MFTYMKILYLQNDWNGHSLLFSTEKGIWKAKSEICTKLVVYFYNQDYANTQN